MKINIVIAVFFILFLSGCTLSQEILDNVGQTNKTSAPGSEGYLAQMGEISQKAKQNIQNAADMQNKKMSEATNETQENTTPIKNSQINNSQNNQMDNSELTKKYSVALIKTSLGDIKVKFFNVDAPITVGNFLKLSRDGFYAGTKFHRVIKGFMIQGGDPLSKDELMKDRWGTGGPGYKFNDELKGTEKYPQGTLAMANSGPNTNGSQFFIVTASPEAPLPASYTVFGQVITGMDIALKIEKVETSSNDRPVDDVIIQSVELLEK